MPVLSAKSFSLRSSSVLAGTALGAVLTLAFQATAAQCLSAAQFGMFAYAVTLLNIGGLVAPLGLPITLVKYLATYRVANDTAGAAALLWAARRWTLIAGVSVGSLIALGAWLAAAPDSSSALWVLACAVPFAALTRIETARLRANGHAVLSVFLEVPMREGLACALLLLVIMTGRGDAGVVAGCYALAVAAGFIVAVSRHPSIAVPPVAHTTRREWWSVALSALVSTAALQILRRMDIVIVGSVAGYADAGIYAAATRIADVIQLPLVAATVMASPKIAELYAQQRCDELQQLVGKVGWFAFGLALVGALPLLIMPGQILKLFGAEFVAGEQVLRWLVAGQLFNALTSCSALLLTMTGHEWRAAIVTASVGLVALVANWILASRFGMIGVAIGTCSARIVWNLLLCLQGYHKTRVIALPLLRRRALLGA